MTILVAVALISAVAVAWFTQRRHLTAIHNQLRAQVEEVRTLVNGTAARQEAKVDRQTDVIAKLSTEIERLNDGASNTPAPTTIGQQPPVTRDGEGLHVTKRTDPPGP